MLKVIALFLLPICVLGVKFNGTMKTALGACSLCDPASYCLQPLQAGLLTVHFWPSATMVPTGTPLHTYVASVFALYPDCNWIPPSLFASGRSLSAGIVMSDACFMGPQGKARQPPLPYTAQNICGSFSPIPNLGTTLVWRLGSMEIIHPQCTGAVDHGRNILTFLPFSFYSGPAKLCS